MFIARIAAAVAMVVTVGAAAPAGSACATCQNTEEYTCQECCRIKCIQLYGGGGHPLVQRCTTSCIDNDCGGGDFPLIETPVS